VRAAIHPFHVVEILDQCLTDDEWPHILCLLNARRRDINFYIIQVCLWPCLRRLWKRGKKRNFVKDGTTLELNATVRTEVPSLYGRIAASGNRTIELLTSVFTAIIRKVTHWGTNKKGGIFFHFLSVWICPLYIFLIKDTYCHIEGYVVLIICTYRRGQR